MIRWILRAQTALTLLAALLAGWVAGWGEAAFVAAGGAVALLLTLLVALRAFSVDAGDDPRAALGAMARGEALKLVLAVLVFVGVAMLVPERFVAVLAGFCAATSSYWLALAFSGTGRDEGRTTD